MQIPPNPGDPLRLEQIDVIVEAIRLRQHRQPLETTDQSIAVILLNAGERYNLVKCLNGEWSGMKGEIPLPAENTPPKCPNGHVLLEYLGVRLGWIEERRLDDGSRESSTRDSV